MKKVKWIQILPLFIVLATVTLIHACGKEEGKLCRTCTAKYQGETIATKEACSFDEENQFENEYSYATVQCGN